MPIKQAMGQEDTTNIHNQVTMHISKDKIYIALFFLGLLILIAVLNKGLEEEPHVVVIEGKQYMRSKEYVGNGHFQVILVPIKDSINQSTK